MNLRIVPYTVEDDEGALALEQISPQGGALAIRYRRPTFHARSSVYEHAVLFCAKADGKVVGIAAGAAKEVSLHGNRVRALYGYDVRIHPEFRRYGTARKLSQAVIDALPPVACMYSYVAGQNTRAIGFGRRVFGARSVIPLTCLVIPVFRERRGGGQCRESSPLAVREACLDSGERYELVPECVPDLLHGHCSSLVAGEGRGGCSIWTNESLLQAELVRLPLSLRALRFLSAPLLPLRLVPRIPKVGTTLESLFIYDLYADSTGELKALLSAANNFALATGRTLLYIMLQNGDPLIGMVRRAGFFFIRVPYVLLARGEDVPLPEERLYIDVRDL